MRNAQPAQAPAPTIYAIPEAGHLALHRIRDYLQLQARLAEASAGDTVLRRDAMTWCFTRLASDLTHVLNKTYSSEAASAEAAERARVNS